MADQFSKNMRPGRVMLWVIPRTTSTAFCKCMSGIPDCEVWYEPYGFGHYGASYIKETEQVVLPMVYDEDKPMFQRAADLLSGFFETKISPELLPYATTKRSLETSASKFVFVKDESQAMTTDRTRQYLPDGFKHSFLIRHPELMFASLRKASFKQMGIAGMLRERETESSFDMRTYDMLEAGRLYQVHYDMWKFIKTNVDPNPIVIDSDDLLSKPAEVMSKYCEAMGLPYSESLLKWDGSAESGLKWKIAGSGLIHNESCMGVAMTSTHFTAPKKLVPRDQLTDDVIELANEAMSLYKEMYDSRWDVSV